MTDAHPKSRDRFFFLPNADDDNEKLKYVFILVVFVLLRKKILCLIIPEVCYIVI